MAMYSTWFIIDCVMVSGVNSFLVIIHPVLRLMNLHMQLKFVVGPRYMDTCNLLALVLVGGASS